MSAFKSCISQQEKKEHKLGGGGWVCDVCVLAGSIREAKRVKYQNEI